MIDLRCGRHALGVCAAVATFAGCGGSQTQPARGFCPLMVPWVQLLYPIPGTKAVSPNVGQMVFAATGVTRIKLLWFVSVPANSAYETGAAAESASNTDRHARPICPIFDDAVCGIVQGAQSAHKVWSSGMGDLQRQHV